LSEFVRSVGWHPQVRIQERNATLEFIIELGARKQKGSPLTLGCSTAALFDLCVEGRLPGMC
jgi:hypothetical protein